MPSPDVTLFTYKESDMAIISFSPRSSLSPLTRCSLLALSISAVPGAARADSPWHVTDGTTREVTGSYSASTPGDYPLLASGPGSRLETGSDGLSFRSRGDNLHAADISGGEVSALAAPY